MAEKRKAKPKNSLMKLLGKGMANKAGVALKGRKKSLDARIKAAGA